MKVCPECGREFQPPPQPKGGRPFVYCSKRCKKRVELRRYERAEGWKAT